MRFCIAEKFLHCVHAGSPWGHSELHGKDFGACLEDGQYGRLYLCYNIFNLIYVHMTFLFSEPFLTHFEFLKCSSLFLRNYVKWEWTSTI